MPELSWPLVLGATAVGGAIGALLRWSLSVATARHTTLPAWIGTLAANLIACVLIGAVAHDRPHIMDVLLVVGVAGALSTFSTFVFELVVLWWVRRRGEAMLAVALSMVAGPAAVWAGHLLSSLSWGDA